MGFSRVLPARRRTASLAKQPESDGSGLFYAGLTGNARRPVLGVR